MLYLFLSLIAGLGLTILLRKKFIWLISIFIVLGILNFWIKFLHPYFFFGIVGACIVVFFLIFFLVIVKQPLSKEKNEEDHTIKPIPNPKLEDIKKVNIGGFRAYDIFEGIFIGGAAGSGKTRSLIVPIMRHLAKYNMGTLIYVYKGIIDQKPELAEYALSIFGRERCDILDIAHQNKTDKFNPLDPSYFEDEKEIANFLKEVVISMSKGRNKSDSKSEFFTNGAVGALTAGAMFLKENHPQYCDIPHLVALLLGAKEEILKKIFTFNPRIQVQARVYLDSTGDQLSGMKGTIGNFLQAFAGPKMFFALYDEDKNKYRSLKFNAVENPRTLILANDIANENVMLPIVNGIMYLSMSMVGKGTIAPSSIVVDEGSTINNDGFSRKPATLREFKCATVYCVQDKSLVTETTSQDTYNAIIANLALKFLGRIGEVSTGEDYVKMFQKIYKTERSYTSGNHSSTTKSRRKEDKYDVHYFFKKHAGEFLVFNHGESQEVKLPYKKGIYTQKVEDVRSVTMQELNEDYEKILAWGKYYYF